MAAAAVAAPIVDAEPDTPVAVRQEVLADLSKRFKTDVTPQTVDELMDEKEQKLQRGMRARAKVTAAVVTALLEGRVQFQKNTIEVPKALPSTKAKEEPMPPVKPIPEEDKEKIRQMLLSRDQEICHRVDVDNYDVAPEKYQRQLPPYCARQGNELTVVYSLVHADNLRRLCDAGVSLQGKNDYAQKLCQMIEHDSFVSSTQFTRGEVVPALVETPVLFALLQRPGPSAEQWNVPAVSDTLSLVRYYRALTNMMRYLLFMQNRKFYQEKVEAYFAQVEAFTTEIHEMRWRSRHAAALKLRELGAPIDDLSQVKPEQLMEHAGKYREVLAEYERATRQLMIDFIQAYEALVSQLFAVQGDCFVLYTNGSVPPALLWARAGQNLDVAGAALDLWKLLVKIKGVQLENIAKDGSLAQAHKQLTSYLQGVTQEVNTFLYYPDKDGKMAQAGLLSMDHVVSRVWFWVSAVYWAAHTRLIPRGSVAPAPTPMEEPKSE
jgi:hypothetical protein